MEEHAGQSDREEAGGGERRAQTEGGQDDGETSEYLNV